MIALICRCDGRPALGSSPETSKLLRRGWRLGPEDFLERLLEKVEFPRAGSRDARTREETEAAVAARIMRKELGALGMTAKALVRLRKGNPAKVQIARHLRTETSLKLEDIAGLLQMGVHRIGGSINQKQENERLLSICGTDPFSPKNGLRREVYLGAGGSIVGSDLASEAVSIRTSCRDRV
jgi:hypothetical protein